MDKKLYELECEYCPPLDTTTVHAIALDFDLTDDSSLGNAREILDALKAGANAEDTSGFDPSGSSNPKDGNVDASGSSASHGDGNDLFSNGSVGVTDATSSLDAFTLEESPLYDKGIDQMNFDEKKSLLQEMFHSLKPFDVEFALRKKREDFGATVEELLNHQYLQNEANVDGGIGTLPKGIDGFALPSVKKKKGKGKGRGKGKGQTKDSTTAPTSDLDDYFVNGFLNSDNRWEQARADVSFISQRLYLKEATVKSLYNVSGHSRRATIIAICKMSLSDLKCTTDPEDSLVQSNIVDLANEFPSVPASYLRVLIMMSHPLYGWARDLAEAIASSPEESVVPHYVPTKIEHQDLQGMLDAESDTSSFLAAGALPVNAAYTTLRSSAFAQASAAYRKSRSSPLMGGAAAHYASVGHAANAALKRERAIEANARVAQQSAADVCDLHGVTVQDANRIAKQYVERWWKMREEWARQGKAMGGSDSHYRVVVGRGSHSSEGKGKLGPAVLKMLKADGWRVDEQVGEIIVRGRVRK